MTNFSQELAIIRRFLRDPDGGIWSDNDILTYWNDAQLDVTSKVGFIEKANTAKYPPEWTWSYMFEWEKQHTDGDAYQCLLQWQARNTVICYPWEAGYFLDNSTTGDSGYRFTHPWEGIQSGSPADIVPVPFHEKFNKMKFLAYNEFQLTASDRKKIAESDGFYRTTSGKATRYWMPDEERNQFVPYPRPSDVVWDDLALSDVVGDTGGIVTWTEAALDEIDSGVITDSIDTTNTFFSVFESIPVDVSSDPGDWYTVDIDYPPYLVKYIRFGALERCYGADTDGFIPSLGDFWRQRKELGINAIKRFKSMRRQDREYRLGGGVSTVKSKHPRLPSEYPDF